MPSWSAVAFGVALSGLVAAAAVRLVLRERRLVVVVVAGVAAALAPLLWDLILRHTGGDFFTDAPGVVFPVSYEDTGSGVFATALAAAKGVTGAAWGMAVGSAIGSSAVIHLGLKSVDERSQRR